MRRGDPVADGAPRATPAVHPHKAQQTTGLSEREAAERLLQYGENALTQRPGDPLWRSVLTQLSYPLAVLLEVAAALAFVSTSATLGWTILAVVALNAAFAVAQERHAQRAVEALRTYLPQEATVLRDGRPVTIEARLLVPGDVLLLHEGQKISADGRVVSGEVMVDESTITGESVPALRTTVDAADSGERLDALWSGTACTAGSCRALVTATGDHTELGRIATLSQATHSTRSPLEQQVIRVSRLIAVVAVGVGLVFLPLGMVAGLGFSAAFLFAIGLLVANVPEGLLPTITLALAIGTQRLARVGAVVKRLSAVQTLGSTTVICTDKTGTLTQNRMTAATVLADDVELDVSTDKVPLGADLGPVVDALVACAITTGEAGTAGTDPTELALDRLARHHREEGSPQVTRVRVLPFAAQWRTSGTVDRTPAGLVLHVKGAPESLLERCTTRLVGDREQALTDPVRHDLTRRVDALASRGLRMIAVARRRVPPGGADDPRDQLEQELCFLGLVGMTDPPRPEVAAAVASCHEAGIRIVVITGDNATTAAAIAAEVGITGPEVVHLPGDRLDTLSEEAVSELLCAPHEVICSRSSPENKMRIAHHLQDHGEVVAMTGDGVNDAPALRRADIGVAMGRSGTDVAREAADVVLTDDNFSTIVAAVEEGRRIYDNVQKFILYIFAHAVPEVVPFLLFALSGGRIPLGLTVLQILAIDLGTETMPALALAREPAEPGIMTQPPRDAHQSLLRPVMLARAWGLLGVVSAALSMLAFFLTLRSAGWHPGDSTAGALHPAYVQATTATFAAIVACQVGTALAARTDRVSLLRIGLVSNPLLLWGIAFELVFTAGVVYLPAANRLLGTAPLALSTVLFLVPFPFVVWGCDELFRWWRRRHAPALAARSV